MYILYELYRMMLISGRWAGITSRIIQPLTSSNNQASFPATRNLSEGSSSLLVQATLSWRELVVLRLTKF